MPKNPSNMVAIVSQRTFFFSFSLTDSYASAKPREEWTEIESKRLTCVAQEGKGKKKQKKL